MKKRKGFGQLIITFAFAYSALLCHFHASELKENGDLYTALLYWFFGLTALAGAFRSELQGYRKIIGKIMSKKVFCHGCEYFFITHRIKRPGV